MGDVVMNRSEITKAVASMKALLSDASVSDAELAIALGEKIAVVNRAVNQFNNDIRMKYREQPQ